LGVFLTGILHGVKSKEEKPGWRRNLKSFQLGVGFTMIYNVDFNGGQMELVFLRLSDTTAASLSNLTIQKLEVEK
jgi:hypothetical protein